MSARGITFDRDRLRRHVKDWQHKTDKTMAELGTLIDYAPDYVTKILHYGRAERAGLMELCAELDIDIDSITIHRKVFDPARGDVPWHMGRNRAGRLPEADDPPVGASDSSPCKCSPGEHDADDPPTEGTFEWHGPPHDNTDDDTTYPTPDTGEATTIPDGETLPARVAFARIEADVATEYRILRHALERIIDTTTDEAARHIGAAALTLTEDDNDA